MKTLLLFLLLSCICPPAVFAQQWIDRQYTYDSLLHIPYGTAVNFAGETDTLHMNIYRPVSGEQGAGSPRPLLIWIHGGGFIGGGKDDPGIRRLCKEFARRGYVTASISYRLGYVSDDHSWSCNLPNYNCLFATDSAEWARTYYRSVQDAKGAIRYLVNRHEQHGIDVGNIFVAGESAGAFAALGAGLLDMPGERPLQTFALPDAPAPHSGTASCPHNQNKAFTTPIARPDLGGIEGDIEPTTIPYTIRGIGNMFGAMPSDLLRDIPAGKHKPAIYSFHQPCDLLVPVDSNHIYWGISWCLTNGYNCYGIANSQLMIYGARAFSKWNDQSEYGYHMQNRFTATEFPYNYWLGQGSCVDQVANNTSCHAYDNAMLREEELAVFFAGQIAAGGLYAGDPEAPVRQTDYTLYPNPVAGELHISRKDSKKIKRIDLYDISGKSVSHTGLITDSGASVDTRSFAAGMYLIRITDTEGLTTTLKMTKQ